MAAKKEKTKRGNKAIIISMALSILIVLAVIAFIAVDYKNNAAEIDIYREEIGSISLKNKESLLEYDLPIEWGTTWKYDDFIKNVIKIGDVVDGSQIVVTLNGDILESGTEHVFDLLGDNALAVEIDYRFVYKSGNKEKTQNIESKKTYTLKVMDTVKPVITGVKDRTITEGETIDLKSGITATDEVDGELEIEIEGSVDVKKAGTYKVEVSATDKSGNKSTDEFVVKVNKKQSAKPVTPTKPSGSSGSSTATPNTQNDESTYAGRLQLAKQEAKRVAGQIIKPGMSDEQKAYAIFAYLHSNVSLQTNQSNEAYKTNFGNEAYAALVKKIAACSGFCRAVTLLCNEAGLQSQHINPNQWRHQWNKVLIDGEWIILDAQGGIFGGTTHPFE